MTTLADVCKSGRNEKECHAELCETVGVHVLLHRTVARWVQAFRGPLASIHCSGCFMSIYTDVSVAIIKQCIDQDGHFTLMELAKHTGIFMHQVCKIVAK
jgi:hypothetical protein